MDPIDHTNGIHGSLRSQLLDRVALLLALALLGFAVVLLLWLPRAPSTQVLLVSVLSLIAADVGLVLLYGDRKLGRLVVRPVARLVEQAEAIAGGDTERRLEVSGAPELVRLAESVNAMADRLIDHQERLKRNVRSLHETNRELVLTRRELVQSEKLAAVGRMAAGIAHEVGNPLGAIIGYLEVARRRGTADQEWLADVETEARRIDGVVRGLLDFARPRNAQVVDFEVNRVVRETVALLQGQGRLKRTRVETDLELPGARVTGDPAHLEQILVNLLLNAEDAIQEAAAPGRITITTSVDEFSRTVKRAPHRREDDPEGIDYSHLREHRSHTDPFAGFEAGDRIVRIEVVDNGVGIPDDRLDHVFEPFYTTKDPGRGTGLGLAVSTQLARGMRGGMTADSEPNRGTRFQLILPCASPGARSQRVEGVA